MTDQAVYQLILEGVSESADALATGDIQRQLKTAIVSQLGVSVDELRAMLTNLPAVLTQSASPEELKPLYDSFTKIGARVYIAKELTETYAPLPVVEEPLSVPEEVHALPQERSKIVPLSDDAVFLPSSSASSPFSLSVDSQAERGDVFGNNYQTVSKEDVGKQVNKFFSELERQHLIRGTERIEELHELSEQPARTQRLGSERE